MNAYPLRVAAAIPAYQAARSIADVVRRTLQVVDHVLVIDDGSTDGTGDAAREAGAEVVSHQVNLGKGSALQTAFHELRAADIDAVITLDADGQHLPEEIPELIGIAVSESADLVLGVRDHLFAKMSRVRRMSNRLSSRLISAAAGSAFSDVQTGFRLYSRRLIDEVGLREPGFDAESAVVVRAARRGYRVVAHPIRMAVVDGRSTSHYRPVVDSLRIARSVIRARLEAF